MRRTKGRARVRATIAALLATALAACAPDADDDGRNRRTAERALEPGTAQEVEGQAQRTTEGGVDSPPWRAARARGVDFRAHGQEPGWTLDIDREGRLVYIGDYGSDTLIARTPEPGGDALYTTWTVNADDRELEARIREDDCEDTMSGERFSHVVTVRVGGISLAGCGRWLAPEG